MTSKSTVLALAVAATAVLAACDKHETPAPPPAAAAPAPAEPVAPVRAPAPKVAHATPVVVATADSTTQQPLLVPAGGSIDGQAVVTSAGELVGISVLVGNFYNQTTGAFNLEACVGERCARGSADAGLSNDNLDFDIGLESPLAVAEGDVVTYRLGRPEGANDLALWTFGAATPTDHMLDDPARTPKIILLLK